MGGPLPTSVAAVVRRWRILLLVSASLFATAIALPALGQERRVALVIGNAAYKQAALANPVNDARSVAARLRALGFDVMLRENIRTREIGGVYREFRSKISPGAVALLFYAGHGIQVRGQNYFPSVDSEISSEEDVPLQSLHLGTLLENMEEAKAGVNLVLLDACRDNPFARRFRSASRGLAKVEAASGTLIHYATRPGSVASDGEGKNGTYTEALLAQIGESRVPVEIMLKRVTNQVVEKTKGRQEPWVEGSLRGEFYFAPLAAAIPNAQAGVAVTNARARTADEIEDGLWDKIKDDREPTAFDEYLKQYPNGRYVAQARMALARLAPSPVAGRAPEKEEIERLKKECVANVTTVGGLLSGTTMTASQTLESVTPSDAYARIYRGRLASADARITQNDPQLRILVAVNESNPKTTKFTYSVTPKGSGSFVTVSFWVAPLSSYDSDLAKVELCKIITVVNDE